MYIYCIKWVHRMFIHLANQFDVYKSSECINLIRLTKPNALFAFSTFLTHNIGPIYCSKQQYCLLPVYGMMI